jgi:DNA-binding transcriptional ArsR family regulator
MTNISVIDALSDPTRRAILEQLRNGPVSVGELALLLPVSQPAVSQHLRTLKEARLVQVQKKGQQRFYSLNPVGFVELRAYVESFWDPVIAAYQQAATDLSRQNPDEREGTQV